MKEVFPDKILLLEKEKELERKHRYFKIAKTTYFSAYAENSQAKTDPLLEKRIALIEKLKSTTNAKIKASFIDNHLFLAIEVKRNLFELTFEKVLKQKENINKDLELLSNIFGFVNELDATCTKGSM